jgi:hypothetical protein
MNPRTAPLVLLVVLASIAAGCGSSEGPARSSPAARQTATTLDPQQRLEAAARTAIRLDHEELVQSLETSRVPAHPAATAGPALKQWKQSVADRRASGIHVRSLSQHLRIVSLRLDPSFESATAIIHDDQRVQPMKANDKPVGRSVVLHERARLTLRRMHGDRFVVWRVEALQR